MICGSSINFYNRCVRDQRGREARIKEVRGQQHVNITRAARYQRARWWRTPWFKQQCRTKMCMLGRKQSHVCEEIICWGGRIVALPQPDWTHVKEQGCVWSSSASRQSGVIQLSMGWRPQGLGFKQSFLVLLVNNRRWKVSSIYERCRSKVVDSTKDAAAH